jgi:hypothetical protein
MKIKIKKYQWDGNGPIIELDVIGFIQLKNKNNKRMYSPEKVRIVAEPLPGFSGASTIIIDGDDVLIDRVYTKTLERMRLTNDNEEFVDKTRKIWIKLSNFDFEKNSIYKEKRSS